MKLLVGRILSGVVSAAGWLLFGARVVLDLIGYSTVPDDAKVAAGLVERFLEWLLSVPWWATFIFATFSTAWLMWVSWPRQKLNQPNRISNTNGTLAISEASRSIQNQNKEKKEIKWNFDNSPGFYFLGMSMTEGTILIHHFQGQGINKTGDPLTNVDAYLRSDLSGEIFPVLFRDERSRSYVEASNLLSLPVGAFLDMRGFFALEQEAIPYDDFMEKVGPFTFFFMYGGNQFRYSFGKRDIEDRKNQYLCEIEMSRSKPPMPKFKSDELAASQLSHNAAEKSTR